MGTIDPNAEPEAQKAAIGPSITHPEVDKPKQPQGAAKEPAQGKQKGAKQ